MVLANISGLLFSNPNTNNGNVRVQMISQSDLLGLNISLSREGNSVTVTKTDLGGGLFIISGLNAGAYELNIDNQNDGITLFFTINNLTPISLPSLPYGGYSIIPAGIKDAFTMSYYPSTNSWVSFHDYKPQMFALDTFNVYTINQNKIYKQNKGKRSTFYSVTHPSYIDILYRQDKTFNVNHIWWKSVCKTINDRISPLKTITHVTVYTKYQCTYRVKLTKENHRFIDNKFFFNEIRDKVCQKGYDHSIQFKKTILEDFQLIDSEFDLEAISSYKGIFTDDFIVIRFEYDNLESNEIKMLDYSVDTTENSR